MGEVSATGWGGACWRQRFRRGYSGPVMGTAESVVSMVGFAQAHASTATMAVRMAGAVGLATTMDMDITTAEEELGVFRAMMRTARTPRERPCLRSPRKW